MDYFDRCQKTDQKEEEMRMRSEERRGIILIDVKKLNRKKIKTENLEGDAKINEERENDMAREDRKTEGTK